MFIGVRSVVLKHESWNTFRRQGYEDVSGDLVVHVELRKWADVALVAPCSANTLSKMALGLCDTCPNRPIIATIHRERSPFKWGE